MGTNVRVTRVINTKLATTGNLAGFLKSINPVTTSVFLCKKIILEALEIIRQNGTNNKKLQDLRNSLSVKLNYLAQKFGRLLEEKSSMYWFFSNKQIWSCPPVNNLTLIINNLILLQELMYIAETLYYLYKSNILRPGCRQRTEIKLVQGLILSSSPDITDCLIIPKLYQIPWTMEKQRLPANNYSLRSDGVVLIDHGIHMYLWMGDEIEDLKLIEKGIEMACEISKGRNPIPDIKIIKEHSNDERYITNILNILNEDSIKDIEDQTINTNSSNMQRKVWCGDWAEKKTEEMSFYKWCRDSSVEPPRKKLAEILMGFEFNNKT